MRIPAKDLTQQLSHHLSPVYVIFGDEPYQRYTAIKCIRDTAKKHGFTEYTRFDITPQFEWDHFKLEVNGLSLFATKKIIECHISEGKIGKKGSEVLVNFANLCPKNILLIIICGKLDNSVLQSTWFTHLEKNGMSIQARMLYKEETLHWLNQHVNQANLSMQKDALHLLYERTEGNLLAAAQAIEKCQLYYASTESTTAVKISMTDLTRILTDSTRFTTFDLVDAVLEGSLTRTNRILNSLKDEGVEPLFILWSMTREVRAISHFCYEMANGLTLTKVLDSANLWKHKKDLIHRYFKRLSQPMPILQTQLHQSLMTAQRIDDVIKGRTIGDVWQMIHFLCYGIMGLSGAYYA